MRVCARKGCGNDLLNKNGTPSYRRHWCSVDCKNLDRKQAQETRRKVTKGKRCRLCGHRVSQSSGVSQDNGRQRVLEVDLNELHQRELRLRSECPEGEIIENNNL